MGKKKADEKPRLTNSTATMDIDSILSQLSSLEDNSKSFITGKQDEAEWEDIWKADVEALQQAAAILKALQDEGIGDPEQVRDLIADYNAIASERQEMYRKYETPDPAISVGGTAFCPDCKTQICYHPDILPPTPLPRMRKTAPSGAWMESGARAQLRTERKETKMITADIKDLKTLTLQDCIELHEKMGMTFIAHNGMITEILQEGGTVKINESK